MNAPGTPGPPRASRAASASATPARKSAPGSVVGPGRVPFVVGSRRTKLVKAVARRRHDVRSPFADFRGNKRVRDVEQSRGSLGLQFERGQLGGGAAGESRARPDQPFPFDGFSFVAAAVPAKRTSREAATARVSAPARSSRRYPHRIPRAGGIQANLPRSATFRARRARLLRLPSRRACFLLLDECFALRQPRVIRHTLALGPAGPARLNVRLGLGTRQARSARACASRRVNSVAAMWAGHDAPELFRFTSARSPKSPRARRRLAPRVRARPTCSTEPTPAMSSLNSYTSSRSTRESSGTSRTRRAVKRHRRIERVRYRRRARAVSSAGRSCLRVRLFLVVHLLLSSQPRVWLRVARERGRSGRPSSSRRRWFASTSARAQLLFLFRFRFRSRRDLSARRVRGNLPRQERAFRAGRAARPVHGAVSVRVDRPETPPRLATYAAVGGTEFASSSGSGGSRGPASVRFSEKRFSRRARPPPLAYHHTSRRYPNVFTAAGRALPAPPATAPF